MIQGGHTVAGLEDSGDRSPDPFSERRVIVTGGATSIGGALLDLLAEQGAVDVTVVDLKAPSGPYAGTSRPTWPIRPRSMAPTPPSTDPVDLLFNKAGVTDTLPPMTVFQVDALAPIRLGQASVPRLREGGPIVNTASIDRLRWADNLQVIGELLDLDD